MTDPRGPEASELWLEIDIAQAGPVLRATARGGQNVQPPAYSLGSRFSPESLSQFAEWVKEAASRAASLTSVLPEGRALREAQELYQALFQPALLEVLHRLQGAAGDEPILLRLNPQDALLKAIPWEALCQPDSALGFLGTSQEVLLARGVESTRLLQPREVEGAVRLLVISPEDEGAPGRLRAMLHESIQSGELEWLEPLTGPRASKAFVQDRLRREPVPHILHFIGHGGLGETNAPCLQMASRTGESSELKVELLALELMAAFREDLRLVVLESCEGARPGELLSAAEHLARAGAAAVVAHLWPVKADVARHCSVAFYRSLTQAAAQRGDVARSLHDARRSILAEYQESAEAFSPVLYLRGHDLTLFDFQGRKVLLPSPPPHARPAPKRLVLPVLLSAAVFLLQTDAGSIPVDDGPCRYNACLNGVFAIRPRHSGKWLGIGGAHPGNSAPLVQWAQSHTNEQWFRFEALGDGFHTIRPFTAGGASRSAVPSLKTERSSYSGTARGARNSNSCYKR